MKKNIIIFSAALVTLCLTAYGFINRNNTEAILLETPVFEEVAVNIQAKEKIKKRIFTDFIYGVGPRFGAIKKEDLENKNFFSDYIGEEHAQKIVSFKSLSVILLDGDKKTDVRETSNSGLFTDAQISLLQSFPYSSNILIWAEYIEENKENNTIEKAHWTPHLTIVPEKQAICIGLGGKDALSNYLKGSIMEYTVDIDPEELQPAKLFFTVTKNGNIENVYLDRTSNFPEIDKKMIELVTNAPMTWEPAENSHGDKIDQELVVSFGLMGC